MTRVDATVGTLAGHQLMVGGIYEDSQAFGSHLIVDRSLYLRRRPGQPADRRPGLRPS